MNVARRFPPPWTVDETDPCVIVKDRNGNLVRTPGVGQTDDRSFVHAPSLKMRQFEFERFRRAAATQWLQDSR